MEAEHSQTFDQASVKSEPLSVEINDAQLLGVPAAAAAATGEVVLEMKPAVVSMIGSGEKRKRGRPPRGQAAASRPPPLPKVTQEDEDVCFICFDGGSLVLCDKKGCPKAYHPTCIKRDEAFFRSKAKWNCGWHICSVCQKASHYMCYTCTYSLCKGCTMDRDYVCVRGNMGFCSTCMRTIMLIENKDQANKELVQVDFDDKTSWEYLFKVYWVYLKERLSLTLNELTQAENPCKGVRSLACKRMLPNLQNGVSNRNGFLSNTSCEQLESKDPKDLVETPIKDTVIEENSIKVEEKLSNENDASGIVCNAWASKELLDFVAHMKDGNASMLSQFDVQELLLKYIKKNNLRDPLKKSQIVCDLRLMNLFGKTRVGHIEMLKLLEFHFLIKEDLQNNFIPAGIIGTDASHLDAEENNKSSLTTNKNKQRKTRKRIDVRTPQNNLEEYAAIDVHNVNLIYLRRTLMENLTQDEKFLEKVIGSVVRIRISSDQKPDIYRLVQVVGTKKVPAAYKVGNRTVDVVLEVLNLNKKESIAIDSISNQDFSQDECRRLRQSIRCGLVKHLTVGDIQKKAMELLTARLDDLLEAEKLKLNHLRDRASEKGRKKDLRVCVEKLQLLDTPEERQRRLSEIPEVHADAKMNPDYESEQDVGVGDEKQDEYARSKHAEFGRSKHRQINGKRKVRDDGLINGQRGIAQKRCASNLSDQAGVRPVPETPAAIVATGSSSPANDGETEKLWHYRDPNGNVQGPFSMVQLRKWSTTGYFPPNMRIWRNHEQKDSVLLTDALNGQFPAAPHMLYNLSLQSKQIRPASDNQISDAKWNHGTELHRRDRNQIVQPLQYGIAGTQLDINECRRIDVSGPLSSGFSASSYRHKEIQPKDLPPIGLIENKFPSIHTGVRHPIPSSNNGPLVSNHHGVQGYGNVGSPLRSAIQIVDGHSGEKKSNKSHQIQSSLQNGISLPINLNPTEMNLNSGSPLANAGSCKETCKTEPRESHDTAVKVISQESEFVADLKLQSLNPKVPPPASDIPSLPSPTPKIPNENQGGQIAESKQPQPGNSKFLDSGPSWSSGSSLVVGSTQLPDKTDDKGERSPTANAGSCGETCNTELRESLNSALKVSSQESEFVAAVELQSLNSKVPPQASDIPSLPSPTPEILNENQGEQIAESKQPQPGNGMFQDSGPSWSSGSSLVVGSTQLPDKTGDRGEHSPLANAGSCGETCNTEPRESHNSAVKVNSRDLESVAAVESLNSEVPLQASDIPSLPSPTPEILNENQGGQIAESKQPQPGNGMFQDSGLSWCSGSSLVSTQLPDKTDDWGEHSPTPAKPIVEEWSSGLVSVSLLKQPEVVGDHATPTSNDDTLAHNSPSQITSNVTSWHGVETIEFTTLGEESVSDLLDEVDAMESRRGLGSPTSTMRCGDAIKGFKSDCFFIDDLSLTLDPGKGDAWSSTGEIQVSFQSIATKDTFGVSGSDAYDPLKRSSRHSSTSSDGETRSADLSHNQAEAGLASHPCPSRDIFQGLNGTTMPPDNRLEVLENVTKKTRDHMNLAVELSARAVVDVVWDSNQGTGHGTISNYGGHQLDGHQTYGGQRHNSSRDWDSQGSGEMDYGKDRLLGNRQPLLGGGGGFSRAPLKGQRVCKFYENGNCKKGASCGYLHP